MEATIRDLAVTVGSAVVVAAVLWLARNWTEYVKVLKSKAETSHILELVGQGVAMVNQLYAGLDDKAKKDACKEWIMNEAALVGLYPSEELVDGLIEAAVWAYKPIKQ